MSNKKETLVLQGTAFWASVRQPNKDSGKFQLDLSIDAATAALLETKGIKVKNAVKGVGVQKVRPEDERGNFVTIKSGLTDKQTNQLIPPKVVDSKNNVIGSDVLIGNGSVVRVRTNVFDYNFKGKTGTSLGLQALQVLELVEYNGNTAFDEVEGFTVGTTVENSLVGDENDSAPPWAKTNTDVEF